MAEYQIGRVVEWRKRQTAKQWDGRMVEGQNGEMKKCRNGGKVK
jgi:hypothetical protein